MGPDSYREIKKKGKMMVVGESLQHRRRREAASTGLEVDGDEGPWGQRRQHLARWAAAKWMSLAWERICALRAKHFCRRRNFARGLTLWQGVVHSRRKGRLTAILAAGRIGYLRRKVGLDGWERFVQGHTVAFSQSDGKLSRWRLSRTLRRWRVFSRSSVCSLRLNTLALRQWASQLRLWSFHKWLSYSQEVRSRNARLLAAERWSMDHQGHMMIATLMEHLSTAMHLRDAESDGHAHFLDFHAKRSLCVWKGDIRQGTTSIIAGSDVKQAQMLPESLRVLALSRGVKALSNVVVLRKHCLSQCQLGDAFALESLLLRYFITWKEVVNSKARPLRGAQGHFVSASFRSALVHWRNIKILRKAAVSELRSCILVIMHEWKTWSAAKVAKRLHHGEMREPVLSCIKRHFMHRWNANVARKALHRRELREKAQLRDVSLTRTGLHRWMQSSLNRISQSTMMRESETFARTSGKAHTLYTWRSVSHYRGKERSGIRTAELVWEAATALASVKLWRKHVCSAHVARVVISARFNHALKQMRWWNLKKQLAHWQESHTQGVVWRIEDLRAKSFYTEKTLRKSFVSWSACILAIRRRKALLQQVEGMGIFAAESRAFLRLVAVTRAKREARQKTVAALHWWKIAIQRRVWQGLLCHLERRRDKRVRARLASTWRRGSLLREAAAKWIDTAVEIHQRRVEFAAQREGELATRRWYLVARCARKWRLTVADRRKKAQGGLSRRSSEGPCPPSATMLYAPARIGQMPTESHSMNRVSTQPRVAPRICIPEPTSSTVKLAVGHWNEHLRDACTHAVSSLSPPAIALSTGLSVRESRPPPRRPLELLMDAVVSPLSHPLALPQWVIQEMNDRHPIEEQIVEQKELDLQQEEREPSAIGYLSEGQCLLADESDQSRKSLPQLDVAWSPNLLEEDKCQDMEDTTEESQIHAGCLILGALRHQLGTGDLGSTGAPSPLAHDSPTVPTETSHIGSELTPTTGPDELAKELLTSPVGMLPQIAVDSGDVCSGTPSFSPHSSPVASAPVHSFDVDNNFTLASGPCEPIPVEGPYAAAIHAGPRQGSDLVEHMPHLSTIAEGDTDALGSSPTRVDSPLSVIRGGHSRVEESAPPGSRIDGLFFEVDLWLADWANRRGAYLEDKQALQDLHDSMGDKETIPTPSGSLQRMAELQLSIQAFKEWRSVAGIAIAKLQNELEEEMENPASAEEE